MKLGNNMILWSKKFSIVYFASVFVTVVFILLDKNPAFIFFNLTTLPILIFGLAKNFRKNQDMLMPLTLVATSFSFFGDFLMLMDVERSLFKTLGICTFVAAQTSYGLLYLHSMRVGERVSPISILQRLPEIIIGTILVIYTYYILSQTNELFTPSLIYAIFADTVFLLALSRRFHVSKRSFISVFSGSFLFIMSASLTAIDFYSTNLLLYASTIVLYSMAHFLVTNGILIQIQDNVAKNSYQTSIFR
jgi:hypothetical protein